MRMNRLNVAGALFFVAGTLILLGIVTAEATYPGYSVSQNYISDLGGARNGVITQPAAAVLDTAVVVGGLMIIGRRTRFTARLTNAFFPQHSRYLSPSPA
jgi:hypothetical membrane protein